ncbi:MAG: translation initiation factor IF-2 [Christensenellales bacterium]
MSETAENRTDKTEIKNGLDKFKDTVVPNLISDVADLKKKARNLLDAVNKKKESFNVKPIKQEENTLDKKEESVKTTVKKVDSASKAKEEKPETAKTENVVKDEKPAATAPKSSATNNSKSLNGVPRRTFAIEPEREKPVFNEPRRIYIPPEKPKPQEKKNVQTRVFDNSQQRPYGYKNQNASSGQKNQYNQNGGRPQSGGQKPNMGGYVAPAVIPTNTKPQQKKKVTNFSDDKKSVSKYELSKKKGLGSEQRQDFKRGATINDIQDYEMDTRIRSQKTKKSDAQKTQAVKIDHAVVNTEVFSIKLLSEKIGKTGTEIIKQLFVLGIIKTINENIDFETASLVASELGVELELKLDKTLEDTINEQNIDSADGPETLKPRPPIVTIMGHVDHGKTSLLDYIRKTKVVSGEAGGITQHIGAYTIKVKNQQITFIDTPGHEAFTAMRARGAQVTDIAVLVVAADDGIMPQTVEAIDHSKSAGVQMIVAVNKIDKPTAEPDKILQQLTNYDILAEAWGGTTPVCNVSAKTGEGIDNLLETILLVAEMQELKANPDRKAKGTIIEARLDKGKGPVATVLVEKGTLKIGDVVVVGTVIGKIRAMIDDSGRAIKAAGPSTPVSVTGFDEVPNAGDVLNVVDDEKFARQLAEERKAIHAVVEDNSKKRLSLDDFMKKGFKELPIIIKADVQGSLEALKQSILKLNDSPDNTEVEIKVIHGGVGGIKESDVMLADTTGAIIIGFNVRPDANSKALAEKEHIDIRCYRIIYDAINDIEKAMKGLLDPVFKEVVLGSAEVRELFKVSKIGTIAGCHVIDGKILRSAKIRVVRDGTIVVESTIASLKHEKDDVKEASKDFDCGMLIDNFNDIKVGDIIEAFKMEQVK